MQKAYIEKILSLNDISKDTSDEEISAFLKQAKWSDKDIEKAIKVLRETVAAEAIEVSVSHGEYLEKLGYHSGGYSPDKINTLLGIKLDVSSLDVDNFCNSKQTMSLGQVMLIVALTLTFAFVTLVAIFWYYKIEFLAYIG